MIDELEKIPVRIKELRNILEISAIDLAKDIGVPFETYEQYEAGTLDIPISILYKIAHRLGTDATVIMTGEDPKMETASVCRAGKGVQVERHPGYEYSSLAYNFKGRTMEPLLVFLDPAKTSSSMILHSGQEFNYVIEGKVKVTVDNREFILEAGDSVYFNAALPHSQCAIDIPSQFITIIQEK